MNLRICDLERHTGDLLSRGGEGRYVDDLRELMRCQTGRRQDCCGEDG